MCQTDWGAVEILSLHSDARVYNMTRLFHTFPHLELSEIKWFFLETIFSFITRKYNNNVNQELLYIHHRWGENLMKVLT